jgi:hypothetical protein
MTSPEVERGVVLPVGIEPTQCALEERLLSSAEASRRAAVTIRTVARLQRAVLPELHVVVRPPRVKLGLPGWHPGLLSKQLGRVVRVARIERAWLVWKTSA